MISAGEGTVGTANSFRLAVSRLLNASRLWSSGNICRDSRPRRLAARLLRAPATRPPQAGPPQCHHRELVVRYRGKGLVRVIQSPAKLHFCLFVAGLFQIDSAEEGAVGYSLRIAGVQEMVENRLRLKGEKLGFVELLRRPGSRASARRMQSSNTDSASSRRTRRRF